MLICVDYEDNELLIEIVLRAAGDLCRGVFGGIAEEYADDHEYDLRRRRFIAGFAL